MPKKPDASQPNRDQSSAPASFTSKPPRCDTTNSQKKQDPSKARKIKQTGNAESGGSNSPKWTGGSWRGKTAPVAGLTRSIAAAGSTTAGVVQAQLPPTLSSQESFRALNTSGKSSTAATSTTPPSITPSAQDVPVEEVLKKETIKNGRNPESVPPTVDSDIPASTIDSEGNGLVKTDTLQERPTPPVGWFGWWSKSIPVDSSQGGEQNASKTVDRTSTDELSKKQIQEISSTQPVLKQTSDVPSGSLNNAVPDTSVSQPSPTPALGQDSDPADTKKQQRSSWFGVWGVGAPPNEEESNKPSITQNEMSDAIIPNTASGSNVEVSNNEKQETMSTDSGSGSVQPSSNWAFWSRGQPNSSPSQQTAVSTGTTSDEIANTKEASKANSTVNQTDDKLIKADLSKGKAKELSATASGNTTEVPVRKVAIAEKTTIDESNKVSSKVISKSSSSAEDVLNNPSKLTESSKLSSTKPETATAGAAVQMSSVAGQSQSTPSERPSSKDAQNQANLVLPAFHDTYDVVKPTGFRRRIMELLGQSRRPQFKHVLIAPIPHAPRKVVVVGCHGLFPHTYVQKVLGAPKGTSIRFANGAAEAVQRWMVKQGHTCETVKIALEGEGLIADRIDMLWKLLLKWTDEIRQADFIMIACHSQGVPVSIVLMSKLILLGMVKPPARLSICSMAGVNLGPFPSYIGKLFGASATELFSLSNPSSAISTMYLSALSLCVRQHVRIAYIGSIDDQLVSIESAIFATVSHPYIYRAVFVDGRIHAPDFLTKLVGFAMKLRNLGVSDHGLIRELSAPLAGSLYSGEGHSRVYEEEGVYDVAVHFALDSTKIAGDVPELVVKEGYEVPSAANTNPYFLPWAIRGVLEEDIVRGRLKEEARELLKLFDEWKPNSKVLKDVRLRLEVVRSHV